MPTHSQILSDALATITADDVRFGNFNYDNFQKTLAVPTRLRAYATKYPALAELADIENQRLIRGEPVGDHVLAGIHYVCFILGKLSEHRDKHGDPALKAALLGVPENALDTAFYAFNNEFSSADSTALFAFGSATVPTFLLPLMARATARCQDGKSAPDFYPGVVLAVAPLLIVARGENK